MIKLKIETSSKNEGDWNSVKLMSSMSLARRKHLYDGFIAV